MKETLYWRTTGCVCLAVSYLMVSLCTGLSTRGHTEPCLSPRSLHGCDFFRYLLFEIVYSTTSLFLRVFAIRLSVVGICGP